ncbi:recombinase family protein [Streptomyces sp. NPDC014622]|uniref:recombinase family protein n=1 Tax=Streptomyces sp. NPDC014622 TaxID=3364874 RepID=UPI0036FDDF10
MTRRQRVLIAVRLSIDTDTTTSPERQLEHCMGFCERSGWEVVGVAKDLDVSATKYAPWERPELSKWLDRAPEFDIIVFWRLDRFVRKVGDLHEMIKWAKEHGNKGLVSATEPFDLNTPMGEVMATMIAAFARMEARAISERVTSMRQHLLTTERWAGGHPPYGYRTYERDGGRYLEISPEEAKVVQEAATKVIAGESMNSVCEGFTERRIPTPGARWKRSEAWGEPVWKPKALKDILRSHSLMGWKTRSEEIPGKKYRKRVLVYNEKGERVRVADPILTEEEFKQLQDALASASLKITPKDDVRTPFLGVIKCGGCGKNLIQHTTRKKRKDGSYWESTKLRCMARPGSPACKGYAFEPDDVVFPLMRILHVELGGLPVTRRVYVQGDGTAEKLEELEESIEQHMGYLKPGGLYSKGVLRKKGEEALAALNERYEELSALGYKGEDRWEYQELGMNFSERWGGGAWVNNPGLWPKISDDLLRAGITLKCHPVENGGHMFHMPEDLEERFSKLIKH